MYLIKEIVIGIITNIILLVLGWLAKNLYAKVRNYFKRQPEHDPTEKTWTPQEAKKNFYLSLTVMVITAGMSVLKALPLGIRIVFAVISFIAFLSVWGIFDILYEITTKLQNTQSTNISNK